MLSAVASTFPAMTTGEVPLSAAAVAVRLRRFWLGEAPAASAVRRSDLDGVWREVTVRRLASTLELFTPYDFGEGDPLDGKLGNYLTRRVRALSEGAVREVTWLYDERAARPVRRPKSTDLDIHAPGDPGLEEYDEVLARLRQGIPADTTGATLEVLHGLSLVGVSRHRIWFAARDAASERAIRTTPGAVGSLHAAIKRVQKGEPLYRVVVDPSYDAVSRL